MAAARRLLMARQNAKELSLERVAQLAGVTRLTVYHQFRSKTGLLESVYDDLARRGRIAENLASAFQRVAAEDCLDAVIRAFLEFWGAERVAIRRLRAMATLDKTFAGVLDRDQRRLAVMREVLRRIAAGRAQPLLATEWKAQTLSMLTSFETFDALAGRTPDTKPVFLILRTMALAVIASRSDRDSV
jgi:AcrR family transcriptional regulator